MRKVIQAPPREPRLMPAWEMMLWVALIIIGGIALMLLCPNVGG